MVGFGGRELFAQAPHLRLRLLDAIEQPFEFTSLRPAQAFLFFGGASGSVRFLACVGGRLRCREALLLERLVVTGITHDLALAFESQDRAGDAIEKPTIVCDAQSA